MDSSLSSPSSSSRPSRPTRALPSTPSDERADVDPFEGIRTDLTSDTSGSQDETAVLTPLRAHYLKKSLLSLEFNEELAFLTASSIAPPLSVLSFLGSPFTPLPRGTSQERDVPFLRFMFRQFVISFPFLASAPKDFFAHKLQPFIDSLLARNLSSSITLFPSEDEDPEQTGRERVFAKVEKHLTLLLGSAVKLSEKEEVVRLSQKDLDRLEAIAAKRQRRLGKLSKGFDVNVVCVRSVSEKGRVRRRIHEEFVIRTRRDDYPDVFVSRRYGDFKSLVNELRKHHPAEDVPPPPQKDRSSTGSNSQSKISSRLKPSKSTPNFGSSTDSLPSPVSAAPSTPLQRERNRLTLRSYIHTLLSISGIASSPVLRSFLTSDPISLTPEEEEDSRRREELDRTREEGKGQFEREVSDRVDKLRETIKGVKGDVMGPEGLTHIFSVVRVTPEVKDLPPDFRAVMEWGRISLASTIFHHFIASDSASETLAGLKRIHGLMPYFVLKGILKISNPVGMIRGVMELFMARPFGGQSLLQRMFTSSLAEEVKSLEEDIEAVKDKIEDPIICEKIRNYIYAPREIQEIYKADSVTEKMNLLTVILRSPDEPSLSRPQIHRVIRASKAHAEYIRQREVADDSDDDEGPEDDDGWMFEDLGVLIRLYARLRDREQLIELIFEGTTAELLKDIITIFYAPLAQVYKAASIADSLGDLQNFINDLIRTVEEGEELSQEDPSKTVQLFIDLVGRHEQAFYSFVHKVHSKGEGLFDSLMKWIELFLTFVREGLNGGQTIALEYLLPHTGPERVEILQEVDAVALYHYKLKVAYEDKVRRRFTKQKGSGNEDATQALVDNVVGELQFGSLITGDAEEIFAEEEEEETDSDESEFSSDGDYSSEEYSGTEEKTSALPSPLSEDPHPHPHPHHAPTSPKHDSDSRPLVSPIKPVPRARGVSHSSISSPLRTSFTPSDLHPRSSIDKPLPPPPDSSGHRRTKSGGGDPIGPVLKKRKRRRVGQVAIEPPELRAIPRLLPIFVELVRTLLQPRPVT